MKISKFISIAAVICISACCVLRITSYSSIKGNGNLVTSEETVSRFEKINCTGSAEVRFHASEKYRTVVTIDENLEEYVEIFINNNVLNIGTKNMHSISPTKFTVDVYCPVLTGVSMSGSGSFKNANKIIASTFESKVSGSGKIEGAIECDNYSATISGSGKITIYGKCNEVNVTVSGSGNFNGNELITRNAAVRISGSGKVNICVAENLKAKISGSGSINYSGEPKVDSNISGSGRIRKL